MQRERHQRDFVNEKRATVRELETPDAGRDCASEGAFGVSEELGFRESEQARAPSVSEGQKVLVSSIGLADFVCIQTESDSDFGKEIILTETMIQELGLLETEEVLVAPLRGRKK